MIKAGTTAFDLIMRYARKRLATPNAEGIMEVMSNKQAMDFVKDLVNEFNRFGVPESAITKVDDVGKFANQIVDIKQQRIMQAFKEQVTPKKSADIIELQTGKKIDQSKGIMGGRQVDQTDDEATKALQDKLAKDKGYQKYRGETEEQIRERFKKQNKEAIERFKKNMDDLEDKATGGRVGLKNGNKKITLAARGTKSGRQQIKGAPEGITMDNETFNAIVNADIPITEKIDLLANFEYGKGRTRIEKDGQEIFMDEGGFKDRDIGLGFNKEGEGIGGTIMYDLETGDPQFNIGFRKKFEEGGRVGLKAGMSKRAFLKLMGGAAAGIGALKTGALKMFGKGAAPVVEKAAEAASGAPSYFFDLVEKIKLLGVRSKGFKERSESFRYKDYDMDIDYDTGDIQIKKTREAMIPGGDEAGIAEESIMVYRPGRADELTKGKTPPDEYDEYTARPDMDGKMKDIDDGLSENVEKEIIDEVSEKMAGGGIARMLGE